MDTRQKLCWLLLACLVAGSLGWSPLAAAEPPRGRAYFPPPESAGGWRQLTTAAEIRETGRMDPAKLAELRAWLLASDERPFAAVVIRHGHVVLEVERGNSAQADVGNVKSCAKAICATVLAIAAEERKTAARRGA